MKSYLFAVNFKDPAFDANTMGYLLNEIDSNELITENQFEDLVLTNYQSEFIKYDLIVLVNDNLPIYRTFASLTGDEEDGKKVIEPFTGEPTINEQKMICLAMDLWNDSVENLNDSNFKHYPKLDSSVLRERINSHVLNKKADKVMKKN